MSEPAVAGSRISGPTVALRPAESTNSLDDVNFEGLTLSSSEMEFSRIIGHIEDVVVGEEFGRLQSRFLEEHYAAFEDADENKLVYMDIFAKYTANIEKYIENSLADKFAGFHMDAFVDTLKNKKTDLDGEIFDILFTFTDFMAFKEMFLDYKAMKEGRTIDPSGDIFITKFSTV